MYHIIKLYIVSFFFLTISIVEVGYAFTDDSPFNKPSNYGISGLMAIPNARVMKERKYRIGASYVSPYRRFYISLSPMKRLELNALITDIKGVKGFSNHSNYGDYKDKDVDFKYQLYPEGKYTPAVAIGGNDLIGTRLYASQYLVFSKQIYPFDFTIGLGNGRYGKRQLGGSGSVLQFEMLRHSLTWLKDSKIFWGIEFAPTDNFALMAEYNPTKFCRQTKDPAQKKYFKKPVKSHFNFGLRWKPTNWSELDLSFQRGNTFAANISFPFNIGNPIVPIYYPSYVEPDEYENYPKLQRVALALGKMGFGNIQVNQERNDIYIAAQNDKYFYPTRALGVIIEILEKVPLDKNDKIHIILEKNFLPMFEFITSGRDIINLKNNKFTEDEFLYMSKLKLRNIYIPTSFIYKRKWYDYGLKPSLQTFLNDPSGFFKYKAGITAYYKLFPWSGSTIYTSFSKYFIDTISTSNKPLSIPVRSDYEKYLKQSANLNSLLLCQIYKINGIYLRGAAGLLETEYGGLDAEIAKPLFDGIVDVGLSGSMLKKRSYDNLLGFEKKNSKGLKGVYTPIFFKTRLYFPKNSTFIDLKLGKFLAGDIGGRFQISKNINGVILSAWYTITNTSIFHDQFNRGYHDYGISASIPLRLFTGKDSKISYNYSLSPWTRDVGQDIYHYNELFDYIRKNQKPYLYSHGYEIFK